MPDPTAASLSPMEPLAAVPPVPDEAGAAASADAAAAAVAPGGRVPADAMGKRVARGMFFAVGTTVLTTLASVASQFVLGRKLGPEFALNMYAVSAASIVAMLRDVGIRKIAVARGAEFETLAWPLFLLDVGVNLAAAAALAIAAPFVAAYGFKGGPQPELKVMLWITAASFVISSFAGLPGAKVIIDMRYRAASAQVLASNLLRQGSQALFAVLGFGALSFSLPLLLVAAFDAASFWYLGGGVPRKGRLTWPLVRAVARDSRWILLAVVGLALTYRVDGLIVAKFADYDRVVVFYAWAGLLTFQAQAPFTALVFGVVMPAFARIATDLERVRAAYLKMMGLVVFVAAPLIMACCLAAPAGIHTLWRGKWDPAAAVVMLLLASTPFRSLQACAIAVDEARQRFDRSALLQVADGLTAIVAAALGVWVGGLLGIAAFVAAARAGYALLHALIAGRRAGLGGRAMLGRVAAPLAAVAVIGTGTVIGVRAAWGLNVPRGQWALAAAAPLAVAVYAGLIWLVAPERFGELREMVGARGRPAAAVEAAAA